MDDSLKKQKDTIRTEILKRRDALLPDVRTLKSRSIQARLFAIPEIQAAKEIFFYVSFRSEVETHEMIRTLLRNKKNISVPLTDMKQKKLTPLRIRDFEADLVPGAMGILEPGPGNAEPVSPDDIEIIITPGTAFSEQGWRIGYGGGFYDRFFKESRGTSYALAFEEQIVNTVPHDIRFDIRVDYIVTEDRIISTT